MDQHQRGFKKVTGRDLHLGFRGMHELTFRMRSRVDLMSARLSDRAQGIKDQADFGEQMNYAHDPQRFSLIRNQSHPVK